jgi:hypothetical protein
MVGLTKASLANIDALAKQARSLGLTTQAFQKMALVAGEAGVEAGKLSALLGIMQRNVSELQQGTKLQTDAFAKLGLTIADLQGLSPDEQFAKIAASLDLVNDATTKTALAMEVFGRGGREAINMISGYGAAAENAALFQERFGIAVRQTASNDVERANDAVGRLGMVMEGLGNSLATAVAPAVEGTANALIRFAGNVLGAKVELEQFFGTLESARDTLGEDVFNRLVGNPAAIKDMAPELEAIALAAGKVAGNTEYAAAQMEMLSRLMPKDQAAIMRQLADETRAAGDELKAGTITGESFRAKLADIEARSDALKSSLSSVNSAKFGGVIGELGALWSKLNAAANEANRLSSALPVDPSTLETVSGGGTVGTPVDMATQVSTGGDGWAKGQMGFTLPGAELLPPSQSSGGGSGGGGGGSGGGGGGGGSGTSPMQARLESLIEGLKTESEVVQEWYDQSLETLNMANDAELAAIGGKQEAIERLEQEHQERLAGIREMGNQWGMQAALEGGAQILGALASTNKKAAKLQGIYSAGMAWMTTLQGAAAELKKGTLGFSSAAAVIAKGIGFVSAIKSASSGTSSGSAPSASAGTSATQSVTETRTANINFYGGFQPTGDTISMIATGLNDWLGDGGKLNVGTT